MSHQIYGLYDPSLAYLIRYVGYTAKDLEARLIEHIEESNYRCRSHRHKWVRSLLRRGVRPAIVSLEEVTAETWQERETFWIASLAGNDLVNGTAGGEGLIGPSKDVRERISRAVTASLLGNQRRKGIPHDAETKSKLSKSLRSSEKKRTADLARRGRPVGPMSEETKKNLSLSKRGKKRAPFSADWIGNMRKAQTGRKHSAETKAKISAAQIGKPRAKGYVHTDETKQKMASAKTGTILITDGLKRKFLRAGESVPNGWNVGRPNRIKQ